MNHMMLHKYSNIIINFVIYSNVICLFSLTAYASSGNENNSTNRVDVGRRLRLSIGTDGIEQQQHREPNSNVYLGKFSPMVAFKCGYRSKYFSLTDGKWTDDKYQYSNCLNGKFDILKYCRKVYPKLNINNIVEYNHMIKISSWCHEEGGLPCKWTHFVTPYRCFAGEFQSEALQVPQYCQFSHKSNTNVCKDHEYWRIVATNNCEAKVLNAKNSTLHSYSILEPCGIDLFSGVEFVCCPNPMQNETDIVFNRGNIHISPLVNRRTMSHDSNSIAIDSDEDMDDGRADEDEEYDEDEEDEEDYDDNDNGDGEGKEYGDENGSFKGDADKKLITQDTYYKISDVNHESENYQNAKEHLQQRHQDRINKVMREWRELENRYEVMKRTDEVGAEIFKKEMSLRFHKTIASLEEESKEEKKQLDDVHEERVQSNINEKKRQATHEYRNVLALFPATNDIHKILDTLKTYIRIEEKDRTHMINRFKYLLHTDQEEADVYEKILLHQLRYIDLRINGTLAMLRDFPSLEKHIRPIAVEYWLEYRKENIPDVLSIAYNSVGNDEENVKLIRYYKNTVDGLTGNQAKGDIDESHSVKMMTDKVLNNDYGKMHGPEIKPEIIVEKVVRKPSVSKSIVDKSDKYINRDRAKELHVEVNPVDSSSYQSHSKFPPFEDQKNDLNKINQHLSSNIYLIILSTLVLSAMFMLVAFVIRKGSSNRRGFVEVDVCTPEEKHLNCMQVNGYENPTYSYFDTKQRL